LTHFIISKALLIAKKIKAVLTRKELNKGYTFFVYMVFETLGIGLIIPVITTLSDSDVLDSTGYIFRFSQFWGIDSHNDPPVSGYLSAQ